MRDPASYRSGFQDGLAAAERLLTTVAALFESEHNPEVAKLLRGLRDEFKGLREHAGRHQV